jgi:hypothetical protein
MNVNPALAAGPLDTLLANANNGYLDVYSGAKPTDSTTAISGQTLLGTLRMNATAFGATSTSTGIATANAITQDSAADASGTPTFARLRKSDGTTVFADYTAGVGSGEVNFASAFTVGNIIQLTSFTTGVTK